MRLDRLPILRFHKRLFGLVSGGLFVDNFDIYIAGAVLAVLLQSKWSSMELNATFISATYTGMLIGTLLAGVVADRFGRKLTFQLNLAIFGLASIACALAPDMNFLIVARFVCGVGLGAELVVGYSTMAEFTPPRKRGKLQTLMSMVSSFGLLASTLLSFALIPAFGWRVMFWIPGLGALFILYLRKGIPESPRWLEVRGRHAEADAILREVEDDAARQGISLPAPEPSRQRPIESLASLKFLRPLILGTILQVVMFTALYGLVNWIPTFLTKQGISLNQSLGQTAFMTLGGPAGAFIAQALTDRLGRRKSIISGSVIAASMP
jgi:putative MFS transporter